MALRSGAKAISMSTKLGPNLLQKLFFHNTPSLSAWKANRENGPTHFLEYNKKVYPPQQPGEEPRPAVSFANGKGSFSD